MSEELPSSNPSKWWALAGVCLGVLMLTLDGSIVNIAVPTFLKTFHCALSEVEWVMIGYLLVIVCFLFPVASLARRIGQKRVFLFGLVLFTFGSVLCGCAPGIRWLIAFRLIQGMGAVCMAALMSSIVTTNFSKNHLGQALGIVAMAATLGASFGPSIGGFLIYWTGWRAIFLVNVPMGILGAIFIAWGLPRDLPPPEIPKTSLWMRLSLFRNSVLCIGLYGRFASMMVNAAYLFVTPLLLEDALKYSAARAGLLLAVAPILTGILSPVFGAFADRFGSIRFGLTGLVLMLASMFTMFTFSSEMTEWGFIARVLLWGLGMGIFNAPNNIRIMQSVPPSKAGSVSALFSMAIMLGQMAGVAVAGALFHYFVFHKFHANPSTSIHELPPAILASSVAFSIVLFAVPLAVLLALEICQAFKEQSQGQTGIEQGFD